MISPAVASTQKSGLMIDFTLPDDENIGVYLTDVAEASIRDENRKHCIALTKDLNGRDISNICKEETQTNKNKFCIRSAVSDTVN